jgi:hypothetical protein
MNGTNITHGIMGIKISLQEIACKEVESVHHLKITVKSPP